MDQNQTARPEKVGTAVKLLYINLGIGVLSGIMEALMHAPMTLVFVTVILGTMWLLTYMIGKGRNWARITFLVMFIIGLPISVPFLLLSFAENLISALLGIGQTTIQIIAMVFLFQKPSSDWFRDMKANK
jgi:hypothetical protein